MFLVFVVTVVNAALIIGGNDTVCPFASIIIGTLADCPSIDPLSLPTSESRRIS